MSDAPSASDDLTTGIALPSVGLAGPLPGKIADLQSLVLDLDHVGRLARLAASPILADEDPDQVAAYRAYWEAALIGYRRCFNTGKGFLVPRQSRPSLDHEIGRLATELQAAHSQFLDQANRHVAHRVSDLQQVRVSAYLTAPPEMPAIAGIGWLTGHFIAPVKEDAANLETLSSVIGGRLVLERDDLVAELRQECAGRLLWCYENASPRVAQSIAELTRRGQ